MKIRLAWVEIHANTRTVTAHDPGCGCCQDSKLVKTKHELLEIAADWEEQAQKLRELADKVFGEEV